MDTISEGCMDINSVGSFCDCIDNSDCADEAARSFCANAKSEYGKNVTGDDLTELKKALTETDCDECCC